jgi:hypothetical protein
MVGKYVKFYTNYVAVFGQPIFVGRGQASKREGWPS